ncbi:mechanosensitive ion channel domain-containing protein [Halegenticoccus tardaugens]|uniref:mechanosensitive ion channel domain-containing protein n=1 Tax=Halegenticoccus tardaugens TaxID=2071624 RepID=UPI00100AF191|nr:mechanosensitive ion channel domain-containing protein [Halegenticoccus tardaugens]
MGSGSVWGAVRSSVLQAGTPDGRTPTESGNRTTSSGDGNATATSGGGNATPAPGDRSPPGNETAAPDAATPTPTPGNETPPGNETTPPTPDGIEGAGNEFAQILPEIPGAKLVAALLVVAFGVYLSKLVVRLLGRHVAKRFERQSVAQTVLRSIRLVTFLVVCTFAAGIYGVSLSNIVLSVTVFSAVVGIILAPIVGSIVSGLFVLADQPYEIGDMIELDDGRRGFVEDITLRYTKIITLDNTLLTLPNSSIRERDVINHSAEDERTRVSLPLLVTYECDVEAARRIMERAAGNCSEVIEGGPAIRIGNARYPAKPTCYIESYADNGVLLNLRYWARVPYKIGTVQSRVHEEIWKLIDETDADVEMAYPHQHLVFDETSGRVRMEVERPEAPAERVVFDGDGAENVGGRNGGEAGDDGGGA